MCWYAGTWVLSFIQDRANIFSDPFERDSLANGGSIAKHNICFTESKTNSGRCVFASLSKHVRLNYAIGGGGSFSAQRAEEQRVGASFRFHSTIWNQSFWSPCLSELGSQMEEVLRWEIPPIVFVSCQEREVCVNSFWSFWIIQCDFKFFPALEYIGNFFLFFVFY